MNNPFRKPYVALDDGQKRLITDVKDQASELLNIIAIAEKQYDVRACHIAKTKLEECVMWITKGITWVPEDG